VRIQRGKGGRIAVSVEQHQPRVFVLGLHVGNSIRGAIFRGKVTYQSEASFKRFAHDFSNVL